MKSDTKAQKRKHEDDKFDGLHMILIETSKTEEISLLLHLAFDIIWLCI